MSTITARLDAETRLACRHRTERHLDELVHDGVLDVETRARLAADQATEHLSRLLRAVEQTGADPAETLRTAIEGRGLIDAVSPAQVLAHRIASHSPAGLPVPAGDARSLSQLVGAPATSSLPDGLTAEETERLGRLHDAAAERTSALGAEIADQPPDWAVLALGPVPDAEDVADRADWQARAGAAGAYRESVGYTDPTRAIGQMPGVSSTERRAGYVTAWEAVGQPATQLDQAAMSDGQLLIRVNAWRREQEWAPAYVDEQLRDVETRREAGRQERALAVRRAEQATAIGDSDAAARHVAEAERLATDLAYYDAATTTLTQVAHDRDAWYLSSLPTREEAERAEPEARRRGLAIDHEADRTTAEEYLAEPDSSEQAEDEHRPVTELDIDQVAPEDRAWNTAADEPETSEAGNAASVELPSPADQGVERISETELDLMIAVASLAVGRIRDRQSQDAELTASAEEKQATDVAEAGRRRREAMDAELSHGSSLKDERSAAFEAAAGDSGDEL